MDMGRGGGWVEVEMGEMGRGDGVKLIYIYTTSI